MSVALISFWLAMPQEPVSLMEHGVAQNLCVSRSLVCGIYHSFIASQIDLIGSNTELHAILHVHVRTQQFIYSFHAHVPLGPKPKTYN